MPDGLSEEGLARARSLAFYSEALRAEGRGETEAAFSNYTAALQLAPASEIIYRHMVIGRLEKRQYAEAQRILDEWLDRDPQSQEALLWLAFVCKATRQTDREEDIYRRMIRAAPTNATAYVELAGRYLAKGKDDQAIELLRDAERRVTEPAEIRSVLGHLYYRRAINAEKTRAAGKHRAAALKLLAGLARQKTNDVAVLYQLGDLYIRDGQLTLALETFGRIEALYPENLQIRQRLAAAFAPNDDAAAGIRTLEPLAQRKDASARVLYYLGELCESAGQREAARAHFMSAIRASPQDPVIYLRLAVFEMQDSMEAAIGVLEEGVRQIPDNKRIPGVLGYLLLMNKDYAEAARVFAEQEKTSPKSLPSNLLIYHSIALQMSGEPKQAARLLVQAMGKSKTALDTYVQFVFREMTDSDVAPTVAVLEQVAHLQKTNPAIYIYLGTLNHYLEAYGKAADAYARAHTLAGRSRERDELLTSSFYFWYGAACERDGRIGKAESLFKKSIALDPENADACNYLAYMWAEHGTNLVQATRLVKRALALKPDNGAYRDTLGWIYYMQGDYPRARKQVEKAAQLMPQDPTITDHLGDIYLRLGQEDKALASWKESFLLDPDNPRVVEKLKARGVDLDALRKQLKAKEEAPAPDNTPSLPDLWEGTNGPVPELPTQPVRPATGP